MCLAARRGVVAKLCQVFIKPPNTDIPVPTRQAPTSTEGANDGRGRPPAAATIKDIPCDLSRVTTEPPLEATVDHQSRSTHRTQPHCSLPATSSPEESVTPFSEVDVSLVALPEVQVFTSTDAGRWSRTDGVAASASLQLVPSAHQLRCRGFGPAASDKAADRTEEKMGRSRALGLTRDIVEEFQLWSSDAQIGCVSSLHVHAILPWLYRQPAEPYGIMDPWNTFSMLLNNN